MKNAILKLWRCIVGAEYGFTEEGNEQWYYFVSLVINLMLIWWLGSQSDALAFTILAFIHFVTIYVYSLVDEKVFMSYLYFGIHLFLLIMALLTNFVWAIISLLITVVFSLIAPDCTGSMCFGKMFGFEEDSILILVEHTIVLGAFILVDFLLPIDLWLKIVFIVAMLVLHPIIDYFEGYCIMISDCTNEGIEAIVKSIKKIKRNKRYF